MVAHEDVLVPTMLGPSAFTPLKMGELKLKRLTKRNETAKNKINLFFLNFTFYHPSNYMFCARCE